MRKLGILLSLAMIWVFSVPATAAARTPEESLRQNFPHVKFEKMNPTPIKGIYEVVLKNGILYYAPESQSIISGEIYMKNGRNVTREKLDEMDKKRLTTIKERQKEIPLEKGLKIGTGTHTVIEFSNPDCSYCRQAAKYLAGRTDMTRYVFFLPFSPQAGRKVKQILCAADRVKAYEEVMTGNPDNKQPDVCSSKDVDELAALHKTLAQSLGINATPFFFIDGQVVQGADIPAIEKLIGKK